MEGYPVRILESIPLVLDNGSNVIGNVNINVNSTDVSSSNAFPVSIYLNSSNLSSSNTLPMSIYLNSSNLSSSNTFPVSIYLNSSNLSSSNALPTNIVNTYLPIKPYDGVADAFGRLRISENFTLGDYKHIYGIDPNFLDQTSNGGSVTFVKNKACCTLSTSNLSNSSVIHQTRMYHHYMPGKSHLIMSSICFQSYQSNVVKRTGYYDDNDGIFLELDGSNLSFNVRSYVTGSPSDLKVSQSNWNVDRFDGKGPTGITLDITKTQLFVTDFQWLGVGRIRCGFVFDGEYYEGHHFYHSNKINTVYMSNPTLPIRCEIFNKANLGTGNSGTMDQICSTVISEGGYVETGIDHGYITNLRTITAGLGNTLPVLCIALTNTYNGYINRMIARLVNVNVLTVDNNISYYIYTLGSMSNVVGGSWANVGTDSGVQYNATATSLNTTGEMMGNGFVIGGGNGQNITGSTANNVGSSAKRNFIAQNIQGTDSSVYAIICKTLTAAATTVAVGAQWREIY